jgi:ATP-dependent Lon protease
VYALLSSLSGLPIRQDLAVTGSVNQQGDIQPIGSVNEKIEGFYDVCRIRGLTGTHGILIPIENVEDLMLRDDVVAAVAAGNFHVYPVARIEEGVELLTGVAAGSRTAHGDFESNTVFGLVNDRLREMAHTLKQFE